MAFDERQTDLLFQLYQGKVHEFKSVEPGRIQVTHYNEMTVRVRDVQNFLERNLATFERGDREMTTCEMMDYVAASRRRAARASASQRGLLEQDLRSLLRVMYSGPAPRRPDSAVAEHCGAWRIVERASGALILPEAIEAQDPAALQPQDSLPAREPAPLIQAVPSSGAVVMPDPSLDLPPGTAPFLASLSEALNARQETSSARQVAGQYLVEIHKKYTISVACFTFVLIGVPLALRFPRGGMGLVLGGGLVIFAVFYVSMVGGEALADRGFVSPALAMWFPNILVVSVGLLGLVRVSREFGSTRGGDFADLVDSLRGLLRPRRRSA
jgi:lipopolysaccharide export system permease protein